MPDHNTANIFAIIQMMSGIDHNTEQSNFQGHDANDDDNDKFSFSPGKCKDTKIKRRKTIIFFHLASAKRKT